MIFAVGMAFATAETTADYAEKYVYVDGTWHAIQESELECDIGNVGCFVMFEQDLSQTTYRVYNSKDTADPASGSGNLSVISGPFPPQQ